MTLVLLLVGNHVKRWEHAIVLRGVSGNAVAEARAGGLSIEEKMSTL